MTLILKTYRYMETLEDKTVSVANLWDKDSRFQSLCLEILNLVEIDPNNIDADFFYCLLFPHGEETHGILIQLNYSPKELENSVDLPSVKSEGSPIPALTQEIWKLVGNLPDAVEIMKSLSAIDLNLVLELHQAKELGALYSGALRQQEVKPSEDKVWKEILKVK